MTTSEPGAEADPCARAFAQLADGRPVDAARSAREALQLDPTDARALGLLAKVAVDGDRRTRAEGRELAQRALALDPGDPWLLYVAAIGLFRARRTGSGLAVLDRALEVDPSYRAAHVTAAVALVSQAEAGSPRRRRARLASAEEHALAALRDDPDGEDGHRALARVRLAQGRRDDARHHALAAVRIDPSSPEPRRLLAKIASSAEDLFGAAEHHTAARRLAGEAPRSARAQAVAWVVALVVSALVLAVGIVAIDGMGLPPRWSIPLFVVVGGGFAVHWSVQARRGREAEGRSRVPPPRQGRRAG